MLPFFHGFGISIGLNLSLSSGGKMVLMPRWDEAQAIRHFEKDGITVFAGAAPVPEALKKIFREKTGGTLMVIVDEKTGELMPPGKEGEIILTSPDLMTGYWQNPEATAATIKDGWLLTGDIGKMDDDGYFSIVDRKKDLIITGGYNVYPAEIEDVLYRHPGNLSSGIRFPKAQ